MTIYKIYFQKITPEIILKISFDKFLIQKIK